MSLLNPQQLAALSDGEKRRRLVENAAQQGVLCAEALMLAASLRDAPELEGPEWIKLSKAAEMSGYPRTWWHDHWREFPDFCRKNGGMVMVQRKGLLRWLETRNGR